MVEYPYKSPDIQEAIDAFTNGDDELLIKKYWLVRVQGYVKQNPYVLPLWERIQDFHEEAPEKLAEVLGYVPRFSRV